MFLDNPELNPMGLQSEIPNLIKRNGIEIRAVIAYTIFSIIFTYPVAFTTNEIPGLGDVYQFLWIFWWFKIALLNFANPYYTDIIYYPIGASLAFTELTPFNSVISIPLQLAFGLVNAYKILWIFSFIASGYGTFLLVKYLTKNAKAAFISGLIFMFCPYHFAHALGHMNLTTTEWIPFYVLFLIKTLDEPKKLSAVYASFFLFLSAMSSSYYLVFLASFTMLYFFYYLIVYKKISIRDAITSASIIVILFGLAMSPFLYLMLMEVSKSNYMYAGGYIEYSADLLGFFIPSMLHPIFKDYVSQIYLDFTGNIAEYTVFAGYSVLLFSMIAFLKVRTEDVRFWMLSAATYFLLSLGPILHIKGVLSTPYEGYNLVVALPYAILAQIPIFSIARVPSRWAAMVMLSLAVLAGYGLNYLFIIYRDKTMGKFSNINILFIGISLLILFEFLAIPFPMSSARMPAFYEQLANETDDFAIIEVPLIGNAEAIYYQTKHNKKMIGGYTSRLPDYVERFLLSHPIYSRFFYFFDGDILQQNLTEQGESMLNFYNIKYIILHRNGLNNEQFNYANEFLHQVLKKDPEIYENGSMLLYKVEKGPMKSFMALDEGWYPMDISNGIPTRWIKDEATLLVYSDKNCSTNLSFQVQSFHQTRNLELYVDGRPYARKIESISPTIAKIPILLNEGTNTIRFVAKDGCERPSDVPEFGGKDTRCLSFTFQNITIEDFPDRK
jgi:hypothetical protein